MIALSFGKSATGTVLDQGSNRKLNFGNGCVCVWWGGLEGARVFDRASVASLPPWLIRSLLETTAGDLAACINLIVKTAQCIHLLQRPGLLLTMLRTRVVRQQQMREEDVRYGPMIIMRTCTYEQHT